MADDFNTKTTTIWGAVAAFFWALPKILEYLRQKKTQKTIVELETALNKENKMEDIVKGNIGSVGGYDLDLKEGKLILSASMGVGGGALESNHNIKLDSGVILDFIASKIPGTLDDAILSIAKEQLKKL